MVLFDFKVCVRSSAGDSWIVSGNFKCNQLNASKPVLNDIVDYMKVSDSLIQDANISIAKTANDYNIFFGNTIKGKND